MDCYLDIMRSDKKARACIENRLFGRISLLIETQDFSFSVDGPESALEKFGKIAITYLSKEYLLRSLGAEDASVLITKLFPVHKMLPMREDNLTRFEADGQLYRLSILAIGSNVIESMLAQLTEES